MAGGQSSLFLVSVENGSRRQITSPSANSKGDFFPAVSRDGSRLAFTRFLNSQWNDIFVLSLGSGLNDTSPPVRLSNLAMRIRGLTWVSGDREIVFSGGAWDNEGFLYRMRALPEARAVDLANVRIEGLLPIFSPRADALAYARRTRPINIWQMEIGLDDSKKPPERLIMSSASDRQADLSPDSKRMVFSSNRSGRHSLWIAKADGSEPFRLTSIKQDDATAPRWSPDGQLIAFESGAEHQRNVYLYDFSRGTTRKVTDGVNENYLPSWSRDGRAIYFCSSETGSPQIWKVQLDGGKPAMVTRHGGYFAVESTDGEDLYFTAGESGTVLRKQSLRSGAEKDLIRGITTVTATAPGFGVTANGIYYMMTDSAGQTGLSFYEFSTQSSRQLRSFDKSPANGFSLSPDGKRILFALRESEVSELMLLRSLPARDPLGSLTDSFRRK